MNGDLVTALLALAPTLASGQQEEGGARVPLVPAAAIELPGVEARMDHLAIDLARERLFIAALGNDIVDLAAGKHLRSLKGPGEPQGILYLPERNRMVVACGKTGTCEVYDGETLEKLASVEVGEDADNLRWDAQRKLVYAACGESDGALAILDPASWKVVGRIPIAGHPESFQIEPDGKRAFVNVPDLRGVVVVDLEKRQKLITWRIDEAQSNFPLALAPGPSSSWAEERLLVGCRSPAKLVVRSCVNGEKAQVLDLSGDTDDLFVDAERHRVYAVCGEGCVEVFAQEQSGLFRPLAKVATAAGARTGLFVPERKQLLVAVPHRVSQRAEVRVLQVAE